MPELAISLRKGRTMKRPMKAQYNSTRGTSTLYFENVDDVAEFYMRGGIFWPEQDKGFIVLAGQDVSNKVVTVFEEYEFLAVDHVLGPNQTIEFYGPAPFFEKCWKRYFADKFFWKQPKETHKQFNLEVRRSQMIDPKPRFVEAPFTDESEARNLIFEYSRLGRLNVEEGSDLHRQLEITKDDEKAHLPAVFALGRALAGIKRYPFRAYEVEEIPFH
jgi:hypothetical protein